jgi:hypothetical protein
MFKFRGSQILPPALLFTKVRTKTFANTNPTGLIHEAQFFFSSQQRLLQETLRKINNKVTTQRPRPAHKSVERHCPEEMFIK